MVGARCRRRRVAVATLLWVAMAASSRALPVAEDRCTTILVGAKASATGTPMTTHSMDCSTCDFRLAKVPQQTHADGARHDAVLPRHEYPRYVGDARGRVYERQQLDTRFYKEWNNTPSIGSIPEVPTTFAYLDASYGIMNEHQVAIGESTCPARFTSTPKTQGGDALFDVSALTRIALGRATTARDAIRIMGDLGVEHGFYGIKWEGDLIYDDAGEALTVTDPKEAWLFHILPDDTGRSAIWAAQRIEDDHVAVVANQFVIHRLNLSDPDHFMASPNVLEVATRNSLWQPETGVPFDFTKAYAKPRPQGLQHYSTRRMWRVLTLANPSLTLSPFTDVYASDYPVSVPAATLLTPHDLMRFHRDHYEGTPFDMTKGPDAEPFGDPDRYDAALNDDLTAKDLLHGHFERAISIFRTSYSFVSVLNASQPDHSFVWFGQYAPHATYYAPVFAKADNVPTQHSRGSLLAFDRDAAFWISALVGNWVARVYTYAHPFVERTQLELEQAAENALPDIWRQAAQVNASAGDTGLRQFLTQASQGFADRSHRAFWSLFSQLATVFHDGYQVSGLTEKQLDVKPLFYPKAWLERVGFFDDRTQPSVGDPFEPTEAAPSDSIGALSYVATVLIAVLAGAVGVYVGMAYYAPYLPLYRKRPSTRRLRPPQNVNPMLPMHPKHRKKQVRLVARPSE